MNNTLDMLGILIKDTKDEAVRNSMIDSFVDLVKQQEDELLMNKEIVKAVLKVHPEPDMEVIAKSKNLMCTDCYQKMMELINRD